MLEAREAGQQDPPCLGLVTRQRQCTSEDIARWQHAELVPQHAGAPTTVEHGDDRVHPEPWVVFETADQTREPGAPAETPDIQPPQQHWRIVADLTRLDLAGSPESAPVSPSPSGRGPGQGALRASPNPDTISPDRRYLGSGQEQVRILWASYSCRARPLQGARRAHTGRIRPTRKAARRDGSAARNVK